MGPVRKQKMIKEKPKSQFNAVARAKKTAQEAINAIPGETMAAIARIFIKRSDLTRMLLFTLVLSKMYQEMQMPAVNPQTFDVCHSPLLNRFTVRGEAIKTIMRDVTCQLHPEARAKKVADEAVKVISAETITAMRRIVDKGGDRRIVLDQLNKMVQQMALHIAMNVRVNCLKAPKKTLGQQRVMPPHMISNNLSAKASCSKAPFAHRSICPASETDTPQNGSKGSSDQRNPLALSPSSKDKKREKKEVRRAGGIPPKKQKRE